jgi:hypothetical protein
MGIYSVNILCKCISKVLIVCVLPLSQTVAFEILTSILCCVLISIHPMALQSKSGLGLLYWGSVTIMFYGVRLLASRPTPVNFGRPMIFCWGLLPSPEVPVLRRWKPALHPTLICCTTHCALPLDHHEEAESLDLLAEPAGWIHRKLSGI